MFLLTHFSHVHFLIPPHLTCSASYLLKVTQRLADGDVLDLGDRCLRVIHLPGHSPGSIALLDIGSDRSLFSGDVVYDSGEILGLHARLVVGVCAVTD